VFKAMI